MSLQFIIEEVCKKCGWVVPVSELKRHLSSCVRFAFDRSIIREELSCDNYHVTYVCVKSMQVVLVWEL